MHAEPAASIIVKFGGPKAVADLLGINGSNVRRWRLPKSDAGGTGGRIPQEHHRALLDKARERGIQLTADDFLPAPEAGPPASADAAAAPAGALPADAVAVCLHCGATFTELTAPCSDANCPLPAKAAAA